MPTLTSKQQSAQDVTDSIAATFKAALAQLEGVIDAVKRDPSQARRVPKLQANCRAARQAYVDRLIALGENVAAAALMRSP